MKKLIVLLLFLPFFIQAQTIVNLNVNQAPELGFEPGNQDTTIVQGESIDLSKDLIVYGGSGEYSFSWSPGKSLNDSTIMNPVASPEDTTNYQLTVADNYGCSFTINYIVNVQINTTSVLSVNEQSPVLTANLFPNPNSGKFKVQFNGIPQEKIKLIVIDNFGRTIQEKTVKNFMGEHTEELEMVLPNGIYTLLINTELIRLQRQFIIK
jgi:hypothetical protein